jgi:hypothetical protein
MIAEGPNRGFRKAIQVKHPNIKTLRYGEVAGAAKAPKAKAKPIATAKKKAAKSTKKK